MNKQELERRKPVWSAISTFYLDTELTTLDLNSIKKVFVESGYSIQELKNIDFYEVKPIVGLNLLSIAGVWSGFKEDWLWNEIQTKSLGKRKNNIWIKLKRYNFNSNANSHWNKFHNELQLLKK
ncbi:MAG: hypothetical protein OCD76_18315 [Reichenbachiella sp.]